METSRHDDATVNGAETNEIAQLKDLLRQEHDLYLRALADFENYRKRVETERTAATQKGKRDILVSLLGFVDSFELALRHTENASAPLSEGLKAIYRSLQHLLDREGVKPIQSLGQKFDPRIQEAIDSVHSDKYEPGTVVEEFQKGYRWRDELLRPARVRVAS